ncbi:threonine/serine exporter family protein [Clostridium rectalis]|uniref:threonine/serine exporter family protein n=1 Tax=Clostridium rectalis TaxID=2040295 RepID=UPI001FAA099F|nr:threonine/serine exporter family protein [Clostridium rectalis]
MSISANMNIFLYSFYAFIATLAFSIIFNIKGKKVFFAALGGGLGWFTYLLFLKLNFSNTLSFFYASTVAAIYSEIMARILKTPVTSFIICSILPLVPGGGMYYTMLESISGDINKFLSTGLSTLTIAGAIAISLVLVSSMTKLITYKKKTK